MFSRLFFDGLPELTFLAEKSKLQNTPWFKITAGIIFSGFGRKPIFG